MSDWRHKIERAALEALVVHQGQMQKLELEEQQAKTSAAQWIEKREKRLSSVNEKHCIDLEKKLGLPDINKLKS